MAKIKNQIRRLIDSNDKRMSFLSGISDRSTVLDLGCGSGANGAFLRSSNSEISISGVDISKHPELPEFYAFEQLDLDIGLLPFPDNHFDAIVFTHVIEHLRSPFVIANEISRVMKPGAKIYVETPNWTTVFVPSFSFRRDQHSPFNFYDDPTHIKPWSQHGLFEFLSQGCQLHVVKVGGTRNWPKVPYDIALMLIGLIRGNRGRVVSSFWNLYGWCIFAVGTKDHLGSGGEYARRAPTE